MRVVEECLDGAVVFEDEPLKDERGSFTRTFCAREFEVLGINPSIAQVNTSFNVRGEPIVNSPSEALNTFANSGIDTLIMGNFVLDKPEAS